MSHYAFHVVFFEDRGWWVAQCLERNLAASSKEPTDLVEKIQRVVKVQIEADREAGIEPFSTLPQAPRRFWRMFQKAVLWDLEGDLTAQPPSMPAWTELAVA